MSWSFELERVFQPYDASALQSVEDAYQRGEKEANIALRGRSYKVAFYKAFDYDSSRNIEEAFQRGAKEAIVMVRGQMYKINFAEMKQILARDSTQQRRVRRSVCVKKPGEAHRLAERCAWWCCGYCCQPGLRTAPPTFQRTETRTSSLAAAIAAARTAALISRRYQTQG